MLGPCTSINRFGRKLPNWIYNRPTPSRRARYCYDVPVLLTLLSREIRKSGLILRLQLVSRHSGNQTCNGKMEKTGLESRGILTSMSFRFGWRVHLVSDFCFFFFPWSPSAPIHLFFSSCVVQFMFSFWVHFFYHFPMFIVSPDALALAALVVFFSLLFCSIPCVGFGLLF